MSTEPMEVRDTSASYYEHAETQYIPRGYKRTEVGVIPEDWETNELGQIVSVIDGDRGTHYPNTQELLDSGYCLFLNAGNVTRAGFKFDECSFITRQKDALLNKGKLRRNDIVLTTRGTVGNVAYFDMSVPYKDIRINSGMVILRNESEFADTSYLYALLRSRIAQAQIERLSFGSAQPQLTVKGISKFVIIIPTQKEQRAIAAVLSDVDTLITALDKLIAKMRAIKTAAMQQLLTGKQRLPGFSGEWKAKRLGEAGTFFKGKGIKKDDILTDGQPCIRYGEIYTRHNEFVRRFYSYITPDVAAQSFKIKKGDLLFAGSGETAEEIGKCVAYLGKQQAYAGGDIVVLRPAQQDSKYLGYLLNHPSVVEQKSRMGQGDAVVHISANNLAHVEISLPPIDEQTAIATLLSDIDAEITALEARRDKTRAIKQGMMQELLTGRTRLV